MDMRDRATQGFIAGLFGAFTQMIFTISMCTLGFSKFRFMDMAAVVEFNHTPVGLLQTVFAEATVWIFCGALGVEFAFILKVISSKNIIAKGALFGILSWFAIYIFVTLFRIDGIYPLDFGTAAIHLVGGAIYGAGAAYAFAYLVKKYEVRETNTTEVSKTSFNPVMQPAMKPLSQEDENNEHKE